MSNDNAFAEAHFRTMKYRPDFPSRPFDSLHAARAWVERFVAWYNGSHLHSGIRFVMPGQRHAGADVAILAKRNAIYAAARARKPERWSRVTRDWSHIQLVRLTPERMAAA